MKIIRLILSLSLLLSVYPVLAAGVSVKPSKLNFTLKANQEETQSLVVENISDKPVIYNLYVDELDDQIYLAPANFRLEVGQKRQIKVKVSPRTAGLFATNLSIVTQDLDRRVFNVAIGVKIPIILQISQAPAFVLPAVIGKISFFLVLPLLVLAAALIILLKRKKSWWQALISKFKR